MTEPEIIYKVCRRSEWEEAAREGVYRGSADDLRDGFIHFSRESQLTGTLDKHFAGQPDLVVMSVAAAELGVALRWEPGRDGQLFPHLYGELPTGLVIEVIPVVR